MWLVTARQTTADTDPSAVEENYLECVKAGETNLLPLLIDLTNPSPNVGWENQERMSILERGPADMVLALGLVHHMVIGNNLSFARVAAFFSKIYHSLVVEFVAGTESLVQGLLETRAGILQNYTAQSFLDASDEYFAVEGSVGIDGMERTMYLLRKRVENA